MVAVLRKMASLARHPGLCSESIIAAHLLHLCSSSAPKSIVFDAMTQHLWLVWCDAPKMLDVRVKLSKIGPCCGAQYNPRQQYQK
jgi:hypothetical protein